MVGFAFFASFLFVFSVGVTGQYESCTGILDKIGDGWCDAYFNNNVDCGYDGGDCCECSCTNNRLNPCGVAGFNCSDPDITDHEGACYNKTSSLRPCASDAPVTWLVNDTASAMSLAEAINCSGGAFNVIWLGSVLVNRTFYIPNGTTLYVTGEGSGAEVKGDGKTRLFMGVGVNLHIKRLILSNGNATYGGAITVTRSSIFLNQTVFSSNTASTLGGAINMGITSTLVWEGNTMFIDNYAGVGGGAVAISMGSLIFCNFTEDDESVEGADGVIYFANNTANEFGGALLVHLDSHVSWYGETSFIGNTANSVGGALFILESNVSWYGETSFIGNTAHSHGGALFISGVSNVSWYGETFFFSNMAKYNGGALFILNSIVLWYSDTSFIGNTANNDGGALYILFGSSVSLNGNTSFTGNVASSSGGAIYLNVESNISVGGDICFLDNEAALDGGAVYVLVGHDEAAASYFISNNNSAILFQGNTCGGNGGALVFIGEVVTRLPPKTTFFENSAEVAGGAIYMSGVTFGVHFEGMIFKSNSAVIGGGLFSTGSGITVTRNNAGTLEHHPTTFIGCEFIGNTATKTGGAIDSGGGRDWIENTSFVGNTASLGGALRIVGTTSLIGCDFVNNLSGDDDGPGISNDGVISASTCNFVGNVFNCQTGFYLDYNDTNASFDTVCKGCDTQCTGCTVNDKEPICLEELEHSYSTGGNATLESLLIERGYWRATNRSRDILACYNKDACLGGRTEDQGYCSEGYEGPYCSVCSTRYTASFGFTCNKCSDNATVGIVLAVAMIVVFLVVSVAFLSYMLSGKMEGADQGIVARVTRFIPLQSVKIVIVVWQILTQFSTVANVVFPSVYQTFLDGVDILNFDLSWLLSARCIIDIDFHDQLLLATLGPLVCLVILGGTYVAAMRRSRDSETARGIVRRNHVSMVLLLTFLVYSSVSSTLFKTFACDELDDGKNHLRADYRIECDSSKHIALEIHAGFMVILYVVGIPAFYGVLLYKARVALVKNAGSEEDESIKVIADLWKPYKRDRFYYEVIECTRRVLLTGALVFIYPNTAAQIAVALMMATFFIFVSEALAPYTSHWDTWCSRTGHAIVFTSMFLALLLKMDVSGERVSSQRVFEWVLIGAHSCLVLVVVVEAIAMVVACRQEVKESDEPRIRPSLSVPSPVVGRAGTIF